MRTLYVLREVEDDGAVADALLAAGLKADEMELENPICPLCSENTLLAYSEGDQYEVVTWCDLGDPEETAGAEKWFLICADFRCQYEEQVERVAQPMGAILFDLQDSHFSLDNYCGIFSSRPGHLRRLVQHLQELRQELPGCKLASLLEEAEFQFQQSVEDFRDWLEKLPSGQRFRVDACDQELTATFVAASGSWFLAQTEPDGTLLGVPIDTVEDFGLVHAEAPTTLTRAPVFIALSYFKEIVVVRGFHLHLSHVDRLGMHHVRTSDPVAAAALGLHPCGSTWWEGTLRRSDIEAWYDSRKLLRVKGHWVEAFGRTCHDDQPAVKTKDPAAAEALGLDEVRVYHDEETGQTMTSWSGIITWDQVEEQDELRIYHDLSSKKSLGD